MLALPVLESAPVDSANRLGDEGALSLRHGLFWLAANLADRQPLLLTVDDLHWSDTPSLDWLGYLLRRLEGLPIVIAVAFRPAEPGMDSVLLNELMSDPLSIMLRPRPLSAAATRQLTEQILGADPSGEFCAACLEASGGNPLLLNELLNALAEEGVAPGVGEIPRVREIGPGAVSRSVRQRLAQLPAEARAFARALAVLGDEADLDLIAALAAVDHEKAEDAAEMLARVDLIHREPALTFVHALVRDAVYLEMPVTQRREDHRRAAAILTERGASARRTAAQLLLSPRSGSQQVVATLREAARDALARSAPANAAVYLSRALDEPPLAEVRGALLFELGSAEALMRDPDAEVHLQAALAGTTDPPTRAEIALVLARLLFWRNATTEAVALLEQAAVGLTEQHVSSACGSRPRWPG